MKRFLCIALTIMLLLLVGGCNLQYVSAIPLVPALEALKHVLSNSPVPEPSVLTETPSPVPTPTPSPTPSPSPSPTPEPTPFTLVWMSDTQGYAGSWSEVLNSMYGWIAEVQESENIVALLHTGDIVQDLSKEEQWLNVQLADALLPKDLLRITVGGNHDIGSDASRPENYLTYRTDTQITADSTFLNGECRYVTMEVGGVRILVMSIAYLCEAASAEWAVEILREHADHYAILIAHSYLLQGGGGTYQGYTSGGVILRDRIVKASPNVKLVLCGHTHGSTARPLLVDDDGDGVEEREVHQFLLNFQDAGLGLAGYLRLMRFDPMADRIEISTYSPYIDRYGYPQDPLGTVYTIENAGLAAYRQG